MLDGNPMKNQPQALVAADILTTTPSGHVQFCLKKKNKRTFCHTWQNARVAILPPTGTNTVAIFNGNHQRTGISQCSASGTGTLVKKGVNFRNKLFVNDPLWSMAVSARAATVGVKVGFVELRGRGGAKRAVILGPGQQATMPATGDPGPPEPLQPTPEDIKGFAALKAFSRPITFAPPPAGNSPSLNRILDPDRHLIVVGLDKELSLTPGVTDFVKSFFSFLSTNWNIGFDLVLATPAIAKEEIASGEMDLFTSPAPEEPSASPFFTTPDGTTWQLADDNDLTFERAISSFLQNALNSGFYATFYLQAFSAQPDYSALRGLLFPG
jgi:hypothetical protein